MKEDDDHVVIADSLAAVIVVSGDSDADNEDGLILRETHMKELKGRKSRRVSRSSTANRALTGQSSTSPTNAQSNPSNKNKRLTQVAI